MNIELLGFTPRSEIKKLIEDIEAEIGVEIEFREGHFSIEDEDASAQGGFDNWQPYIMCNSMLKIKFDEESLTHELFHIRRFLKGALILCSKDEFLIGKRQDEKNRISFAKDITNQIEHIAIFPSLEKYGFNPHLQADIWKLRQIEKLNTLPPKVWGEVDHSWSCIKIGVGENIGVDKNIQQKYIASFSQIDKNVEKPGKEIGEILNRWSSKLANTDSYIRDYDHRRLYHRILSKAGIPKKAALFLKKLDCKNREEKYISIS